MSLYVIKMPLNQPETLDFDLYPIVELSSKKQEEWNKTYK